jgi:hypothetical protein
MFVAEDCSRCGSGDDPADVQRMPGTGVNGGADQNCFSGHRDARAFQHHDYENRAIAALSDKVLNRIAIEEVHACYFLYACARSCAGRQRLRCRVVPNRLHCPFDIRMAHGVF